jgi:AraC family transcriptional regulator of adaptative response / DNA-3-methyladenine glycosylase II
MIGFLAARAIPGVESIDADAYRRSIEVGDGDAGFEVRPDAAETCLHLRVTASRPIDPQPVAARVRRIFDLDCDVQPIARLFARDARLGTLVASRPGLRVPGAWNPFEMAVRAILGQQVSVRAASTLSGRLVHEFGAPAEVALRGITHHFPAASRLADADVQRIGIPGSRAETIRGLARAVADGSLSLDGAGDLNADVAALVRIKGIGPWTAQYIAMRALGRRDAFPAGDLGIRKALARKGRKPTEAQVVRIAESWRPYRSYAAMHLWNSL